MPDIVHVACKLPHGLVLGDDVAHQNGNGGSRDRLLIKGTAYDRGAPGEKPALFGGYALTFNVPADRWEAWLKANVASAMVTRNLVFADADAAALKARAKSLAHVRSGLEQR